MTCPDCGARLSQRACPASDCVGHYCPACGSGCDFGAVPDCESECAWRIALEEAEEADYEFHHRF